VPLLVFALWLWGPNQRQLVFKVMMALAISLTLSWIFGVFFRMNVRLPPAWAITSCIIHPITPSQAITAPSALPLRWPLCSGTACGRALLIAVACAIAWSRVYLGVHWPLDMLGGLLTAMIACLSAQLLWQSGGKTLYQHLQRLYRLFFSLPIRKGWVRE
jgi:undecaprenyl-diphosphatase